MAFPIYTPNVGGIPQLDPISVLGGMTVYNSGNVWTNVNKQGDIISGVANAGGSGPLIDIAPADRDLRPSNGGKSTVSKVGGELLDRGRDAVLGALKSNPATAPFAIGADALGLGGGCGLLCQFQKWIAESGFFQRLALGVMALIFIAVALTILGRGAIVQQVAGKAGDVVKKASKVAA